MRTLTLLISNGGNQSPQSPSNHDYQYINGDGSQNGEDENTASQKLIESRQARKKAEEDAKLLANRIALLKMEEQKMTIQTVGMEEDRRNKKEGKRYHRMKEQRQKEKELEEKMLAERNQNLKQTLKETIQQYKEQHLKKLQEEAERVKLEKNEQQEMLNMQRQQEQLKNASMKQMIKNLEQQVEERKIREMAEKKAKIRQELQQKIIEENQKRVSIQKEAYDHLEGALAGQIGPQSLRQSQTSFQRNGVSPTKSFGNEQNSGRPQTTYGNGSSSPYILQNAK